MNRKRQRRMTLGGAAFTLAVTLALLTGVIRFFAGSPGLFEAEMRRFAPPEYTGLPEGEYPAMAAHIADYLAGRKDSFQYTRRGPGEELLLCFHEYELIHMADCRDLIRLDARVCGGCAGAALLLGALFLRRRKQMDGRRVLRGAEAGLGIFALAAAALILWAWIDFDGLFLTFHRAAFRNDYWLLNPRTDLLIRLMPQGMFVDLGIRGLTVFLAGEAALAGALLWLRKKTAPS